MHPKVRDVYKRILFVGREYPLGLDWVRKKAKPWFRQNAHLTDEREILQKVHEGRFYAKEMEHVIKLKKYRKLSKRYGYR